MNSSDNYYSTSFPFSSEKSENRLQLPRAVIEIGKINFEGNIIPHEWYRRITLPSGKPDLPAITILAEIVFWYRPIQTLDRSGKPIKLRRFYGDKFQSSAAYYEEKFGLTKDQTRKALKRLADGGYIRREYREVIRQGIRMNNVMFMEPVPAKIMEITHPAERVEVIDPPSSVGGTPSPAGDTLSPADDTLSPVGDTLSPVGQTNTEITTRDTLELSTRTTTTTTTPADRKTEEEGSSSSKEEKPELTFDGTLAKSSPAQRQRTLEILEGLDQQTAQQVLDEFSDALRAGTIKKSKWAWLVCVARRARTGNFTSTSELPEYREKQAQAIATTQLPVRTPSAVWAAYQEKLRDQVTPADYSTYIGAIRGTESNNTLWLEAPNHFAANWVRSHLTLIEQVLRPHTQLAIRVCIG